MPGGPMSEEEYLYLDRSTPHARYEYVDGVARLMSGGSGEHDQISYNVRSTIGIHLQSGPCFVRGSDMQVLVGTRSNGRRNVPLTMDEIYQSIDFDEPLLEDEQ